MLVAIFGAIVLGGAPIGAADSFSQRILSASSTTAFAYVFFTGAVTMTISFVAMILVQEKPLAATLPSQRV
jgi:hypothetical protein